MTPFFSKQFRGKKMKLFLLGVMLIGVVLADKNDSCRNDLNIVLDKLSHVIQPPTASATFSAVQYLQTIRTELKLLLEMYKDYKYTEVERKELLLVAKETPPSDPPKGRVNKLKEMLERRSRRI